MAIDRGMPTGSRNDLRSLLGVRRIRKIYLQLQYRCNFNCVHCFHGVNLRRDDAMPLQSVVAVLKRFAREHYTQSVCFLGGEPLLYSDLVSAVRAARALSMTVEICTNGYRREFALRAVLPYTDLLRVSLDGDEIVHDSMRKEGSFKAALSTLRLAREMYVATGVTVTLTAENIRTIPAMYGRISELGISEIIFHRLRHIGNAATNKLADITVEDAHWLQQNLLADAPPVPALRVDSDILALLGREFANPVISDESIDRVEISPDGQLYMSCKAVGSHMNSFRYDIDKNEIRYAPHPQDEIRRAVKQVNYVG